MNCLEDDHAIPHRPIPGYAPQRIIELPLQIIELLLSQPGTKANAANNEGNTALDTLEQIAARDSDANVANDSYCRRMTIIKQLKARKRANPASLTDMQMKLIAVVGLIGTVTIQAVLSPPGALCKI
ncbi:hypothetical protein AAC387_Pa04g0486 [Persea americana]